MKTSSLKKSLFLFGFGILAFGLMGFAINENEKSAKRKYGVKNWKKMHLGDRLIDYKKSNLYNKFNRLLKEYLWCMRTLKCCEFIEDQYLLDCKNNLISNCQSLELNFAVEDGREFAPDEILSRSISLMQDCRIYKLKRYTKEYIKSIEKIVKKTD